MTNRKEITVDWNDIKSIVKAEREQARLFNKGYKIDKETIHSTPDKATLTFIKITN